jgi:O-antigen/teichoic acid export membrane protein
MGKKPNDSIHLNLKVIGTLVGSSGLSILILFFGTIAVSHFYSPKEFGEYALIVVLATLIGPLLTLSIEQFIVPAKLHDHAERITDYCFGLFIRNILIGIIVITAYTFSYYQFDLEYRINPSVLGSGFLLGLIYGAYSLVLQKVIREKNFKALSLRGPIQNGSMTLGQLILSFLPPRQLGLLFGELIGRALTILFLLKSQSKLSVNIAGTKFRCLAVSKKSAISNFLSIFMELVSVAGVVFFVSIQYGEGAAGLLALGYKIINVPIVLFGATVSQYFFATAPDSERRGVIILRAQFDALLFKLGLLGLVIGVLMFSLAPVLIPLLLGEGWGEVGEIITLLSPFLVISLVWTQMSIFFQVKQMWTEYLIATSVRVALMIAAMASVSLSNADFLYSLIILNSVNAVCVLVSLAYLRNRIPAN